MVETREKSMFVPLPDLKECPAEGTQERLWWWYGKLMEAAGIDLTGVKGSGDLDPARVVVHPEDMLRLWMWAAGVDPNRPEAWEEPRDRGEFMRKLAVLMDAGPSSSGDVPPGYVLLLPGWVTLA
ncbi:hypothetical protein [Ammonifex thiophilus]|uniref:Uncharacterized protein n=1 Tax=Ammonifex thiophilus TaxID=444093 RepID=A0A3D8P6R8_9THEO|nr:hypothetical protein [Ammonifex thiophilus]RDV83928.1 hypothetical protein DXX99_03580 [Ammonifex thiophilus]